MSELTDIKGRPEIEQLVNRFYESVGEDDLLGFIFNDVAKTNWETHLPKMYSFWEKVLFRTGDYKGNPLGVHAKLTPLTTMGREQFDRWIKLFNATVDTHYAGENADHIKNCATDMANVIHGKINHIPDPRFDAANLTVEQRARYAEYRNTP